MYICKFIQSREDFHNESIECQWEITWGEKGGRRGQGTYNGREQNDLRIDISTPITGG